MRSEHEQPVVPAADDPDPVAANVVDALARQRHVDRDRAWALPLRHLRKHPRGVLAADRLPAPGDQEPLRTGRRRLAGDDPNMVRPGRRRGQERGHGQAHG